MGSDVGAEALSEHEGRAHVDEGTAGSSAASVQSAFGRHGQVLYFVADVGVCIGRQRHALKARGDCFLASSMKCYEVPASYCKP